MITLPPSQAHIWGVFDGCSGWALQSASRRDRPETVAQREGKEAHALGAAMVRSYARAGAGFPGPENYDPEMYRNVKAYADKVRETMINSRVFGGPNLKIEEIVTCPSISEVTNGVVDFALFDRANNRIYVDEYKSGFIEVEAVGNKQGVCYISGLLDHWGINGLTDQRTVVTFRVHQPNCHSRSGPVKEWVMYASDIRGEVNILRSAAQAALGTNVKCKSGPWCTNCAVRYDCDTCLNAAITLYESTGVPMVDDVSPKELARRYELSLRFKEISDSLAKAYTNQMEHLLRSGKPVPGYFAQPKFGNMQWTCSANEAAALGDIYGKNLRKNDVCTPTQAIKDHGVPEGIVMAFATRKQTGFEIVPESKLISHAKEIFS